MPDKELPVVPDSELPEKTVIELSAEEMPATPEPLIWEPRKVSVFDLKSNPQNPKVHTPIGKKRLQKSLGEFGLAGSIVANLDLTIIDGHSRVEEAASKGLEEVWVSLPNRLLTEKEYKLMNAMYDVAKAGEPDMFMIENLFSDEVLTEWDTKKPKGQKTVEKELYPIVPKYDEKHDAIIILCSTQTETTFVQTALGLDTMMSYKNKSVGQTFVATAEQFIKALEKKK